MMPVYAMAFLIGIPISLASNVLWGSAAFTFILALDIIIGRHK